MKKGLACLVLLIVMIASFGCNPNDEGYVKDLEARVSNLQVTIRDLKVENERLDAELKSAKAKNNWDEALIAGLEKRIEELLQQIRDREAMLRNFYKQAELDIDKLVESLKSAGFENPNPGDNTPNTEAIGDGILLEKSHDGSPAKLIIAGKILFPSGEFRLTKKGQDSLLKIAKILKENIGNSVLRIDGHTDNVKVKKDNDKGIIDNAHLSSLRAYTVYSFLIQKGNLDPKKVFFSGWGENKPIDSNATEEGRHKNRRVEILILPPDGKIEKPSN